MRSKPLIDIHENSFLKRILIMSSLLGTLRKKDKILFLIRKLSSTLMADEYLFLNHVPSIDPSRMAGTLSL